MTPGLDFRFFPSVRLAVQMVFHSIRRVKMKRQKRSILPALFTFFILVLLSVPAHADDHIRQTSAASRSAKIVWDNPEETNENLRVNSYDVALGKSYSNPTRTVHLAASKTSYVFTGLKPYSVYFVRVYYNYTSLATGREYKSWYSVKIQTVPDKVTNITYNFSTGQKGFNILWNAPSGDSYGVSYQFILTDINGKTMKSIRQSRRYFYSNTYKVTRVARARIRPYIEIAGKVYYGSWTVKSIVPQPVISTDKTQTFIKDGKLTLTWSRVTGAQNYAVYISTTQDSGYKRVKLVSGSATGVTLTKFGGKEFQNNTTYYVIVVTRSPLGSSAKTYGTSVRLSVY